MATNGTTHRTSLASMEASTLEGIGTIGGAYISLVYREMASGNLTIMAMVVQFDE
jgi:hypothetical protein